MVMIENNTGAADHWGPPWLFEDESCLARPSCESSSTKHRSALDGHKLHIHPESAESVSLETNAPPTNDNARQSPVQPEDWTPPLSCEDTGRDARNHSGPSAIARSGSSWPLGDPFEPLPSDHPFTISNERHWQQLGEYEYRYLTLPRPRLHPCVCCGGRYRHSQPCEMMRQAGLGVVRSQRRRY